MYLNAENSQHCRNLRHVLIKLIKFVVVDGSTYFSIIMIYQNRMNSTEIIILVSISVPLDLRSVHDELLEVLAVSCHPK
jgi:hypothetical protein